MLPEGWVEAPLLDIVDLHDSRRIPLNAAERAAMPGDYPYYGANGQVGTVGAYLFEGRYILVAEDGGHFDQPERGVAYEVDGKFWVNNHAHILSSCGDMPTGFLTRLLNSIDWMQHVAGTTRLKLTQGGMQRIKLPLPPLAEQRRIVAKLDTLTARLARARAELDRVPVLARHLRAEALRQVFGVHIENNWSTLQAAGLSIEAGKNLKCDETPPGPHQSGVVKVSAVSSEQFRPFESKTLPATYRPPARDRIQKGDLLLARASGSLALVGRVALVDETPGNLFLSDKVLRLRLDPALIPWVHWFLRSTLGRSQIEDAASGISMHNITQGSLLAIRLPIPKAEDRAAKVELIEAAFARADRLEAEAARARALLDRLEAATLAKAFRGELVAQNPNDELAETLLARIRQQRAASPQAKRGRKAKAQA